VKKKQKEEGEEGKKKVELRVEVDGSDLGPVNQGGSANPLL
jgi:hypothetical protein